MKIIAFVAVALFGVVLFYGTTGFPPWGDPQSPAATHLSPYFIEHTMEDTAVPNIVTSVLADYRGYDTMFETTVIFSAGVACLFLLRVFRRKTPQSRLYRHVPSPESPSASNKGASCPKGPRNSSGSTPSGSPTT